mmetsp:Transcript_22634/g.35898  ORF Transcript_22634/g.35898 Transcript_22634/m.35898 type:complete len:329 (-) Transcript_22634:207-1193(-)
MAEPSQVRRRGNYSPPRTDTAAKKKVDAKGEKENWLDGDACDSTDVKPSSEVAEAEEDVSLKAALALMRQEKFEEAVPILEKLKEAMPEDKRDGSVLHNLGACYSSLNEHQKAEDVLWIAAEAFEKNNADRLTINKTLYALGSVMTEQEHSVKLEQAEMLLCKVLESSDEMQQKENQSAVVKHELSCDLYRTMLKLGQNLAKQKKWERALDAWRQVVEFDAMFFKGCGTVEEHKAALENLAKQKKGSDDQRQELIRKHENDLYNAEKVEEHKAMLAKAEKLARWQPLVRHAQLGLTVLLVLCLLIYYYYYRWSPATETGAAATTKEAL